MRSHNLTRLARIEQDRPPLEYCVVSAQLIDGMYHCTGTHPDCPCVITDEDLTAMDETPGVFMVITRYTVRDKVE